MRRSSRWAEWRSRVGGRLSRVFDDSGSASLEFLTVGVLLLVPLVYLVLVLGQIQHAVLGLEGGARHAARTVATADSRDVGMAAADRALRVALADAGLASDAVDVVISCAPQPDACDTPRGTVTVRVAASVPLPFAPPVLGLDVGLAVPISAVATQPVSAFRGAP